MITYRRKAGTIDVSVVIRVIDSTDGTPETGFAYNTPGIDLWYRREGEASIDITEVTQTIDGAHADGGVVHINDGYVRVDLPDDACDTAGSSKGVLVGGTATGMVVIGCYIELVSYDPFDNVRLGLTALPNAAADAAGGLPISDAGGLDLDTKLANTNEVTAARMGALTDWINGGRLDLILDIIAADTTTDIPALIDALPTAAEIKTAMEAGGGHLALILADTGELQTDWVNGGRLDLLIDGIKTKTDYLPSVTAGAAGGVFIAGANAATSITTALTANLTGNITGNLSGTVGSVTGAVGSVTGAVGSVAANGITATSIATDAINAAAVKADAVTKIQAGLATPTNITAGTITTVTNLTNAPTNGDLTATMKTSVQTAATASLTAYDPPTKAELDTAQGAVTVAAIGANVITAASIAAGAIDNATFAADVGSTAYATNIIALATRKAIDDYDPPTKAELDTAQGAVTVSALGANVITAASLNADAGTEIAAAVMAKTGAITSLSIELLIERLYEMINNKMIVTEATGNVQLRNLADGADVATGNVQDLGATTVRAGLTWA